MNLHPSPDNGNRGYHIETQARVAQSVGRPFGGTSQVSRVPFHREFLYGIGQIVDDMAANLLG